MAHDEYQHLRESADAAYQDVGESFAVRTDLVDLTLVETGEGAIEVDARPRLGGYEIEAASDVYDPSRIRTTFTARPVRV